MLALIVGAFTCGGGFVYDDHAIIEQNTRLDGVAAPFRLLLDSYWGERFGLSLYRPLTLASFAVEANLFGRDSALPFHLASTLLYAIVAVLVAILTMQLGAGRRTAMLIGALFAVHPIHTEAVASLVGRAELGSAAFVLLTAIVAARCSRRARWGWGGALAAGLCVACALGFKESGIVALAALVWTPLLARGSALPAVVAERGRHGAGALLLAALAVGLWALARGAALSGVDAFMPVNRLDNPLASLPGAERVAGALALSLRAASMSLWPWPLSADYSLAALEAPTSLLAPAALGGALMWIGGILVAIFTRVRAPLVSFGLMLFFASLLPTSNLVFPIGTIFAERLLFLPSTGVVIALAGVARALSRRWPGSRRPLIVAAWLAILAGGAAFATRGLEWRDEHTLSAAITRVQPGSAKGWSKLGWQHWKRAGELEGEMRTAQLDEARRLLRHALEIYPEYIDAQTSLAIVELTSGDSAAAEAEARRAIDLAPAYPRAHLVLVEVIVHRAVDRFLAGDPAAAFTLSSELLGRAPEHPGRPAVTDRLPALLSLRADAAIALRRFVDAAADIDTLAGVIGEEQVAPLRRKLSAARR